MPYIGVKLSVNSTQDQNDRLKSKLGKAIALLPGKSEGHLMVGIEPNVTLYMAGSNAGSAAFVEVKLLGRSTREAYSALTEEICRILQEDYSITDTYVKFEEIETWGHNGRLF